MKEVKIYTIVSDQLSPPITGESFCTDMVRHSDYAELEDKYAALAADNDKAMESLKQADAVVKLAHEKFSALASENAALKKSEVEFNEYCRRECEDVGDTWVDDFTETPATDTFLAEVTQEAVESLKKEIEWLKKQLLMSVGDIRDLIDYNPENGVLTAKVNFSGRQAGSVIGSQTWQGYYAFSLFGKKCFAHRLAWLLHYGEWPSQPIDHINGIKTDNSIRNLRLCSLSQNQFNKPTQKNNTTGVKGVYWNKRDKRYVASVQFNGKKYSAGHHKDIDSAKEAVMKLREKLAGEFTNHGEFELAAQLRKGASL
ncbi:endonuclease [Salmonella enterica subsp. enterica serovar Muenchen]|nr:endonuclease [Salmonella enterica subsp. enterica serovar Muenchen]EDI5577083.1 endonuclease [Salmonella enterica subsp. enterica serovar Newport]EDJ4195140.1 endonuclease [Salmonella enterica]EDL5644069.1 endonuclease [Salmonella enterica subsp. enterica serovar Infantis]EDZ36711.1 HNH endonuclease family protein [Salmonella enterica subsp. enterica serovar Hadar str. RI_05P066]KKD83916.1 endonuclease [Salmonella enterica subsp. enterica serovar Hadar]